MPPKKTTAKPNAFSTVAPPETVAASANVEEITKSSRSRKAPRGTTENGNTGVAQADTIFNSQDHFAGSATSPEVTASAHNAAGRDLDEAIRRRAYEIYQERGGQDGADQDDWYRAEQEILGRSGQQQKSA